MTAEDWKNVGDAVQSFVAAAAIIIGGVFTYFKFVKDRVYRPRVELGVEAGHVTLGTDHFLAFRVTVANHGATKLSIAHDGTAVRVRRAEHGAEPFDVTRWSRIKPSADVDVLWKHDWIESTETIGDEEMVRVSHDGLTTYHVEFRLMIKNPSPWRRKRITITSGRFVLPTQMWSSETAKER